MNREQGMIERVARAMCDYNGLKEDSIFNGTPMWASYINQATAMISVMREPTEAIIVDSCQHEAVDGRATSRNIWQAMIDATVGEGFSRAAGYA
jgi:hypothetical protein